jgi:hypothetical protein
MFEIADQTFPIKIARLEPFYSDDEDRLCWGVFCVADGGQTFGGEDPCINFDRLLETRPGQLASWRDLAGTKLGWSDPAEGPEGLFNVWEGEEIRDCQWEFERGEGNALVVKVQGITDIRADVPFDRDVPPLRLPPPRPPGRCRVPQVRRHILPGVRLGTPRRGLQAAEQAGDGGARASAGVKRRLQMSRLATGTPIAR